MRILYATMQFGHGYSQGTERYLSILSTGAAQAGHDVTILAGDPEQRGGVARLGDVVSEHPRVLVCPTQSWMAVEGTPASTYLPLLDDFQPDLLHLANPGHIGLGILAAAVQRGIPVVVTVMDYWWRCPKHTLHHFRRGVCDGDVSWQECVTCIAATHDSPVLRIVAKLPLLRGAALQSALIARARRRGVSDAEIERWKHRREYIPAQLNDASVVIFPSKTAAAIVEPLLDEPQSLSIPYGLEPHWFAAPMVQPSPRAADDPVIGFAGALQPHKGPHLLLEALRRLGFDRVHVRIAGGGNERYIRELRGLARDLRVEFLGRVAPADMPAFLRSLDLLVLPSLWPENLPIMMLEAYACGVPVLGSDVGGVREFVSDEAWLFPSGSVSALAERLSLWRSGRLQASRDSLPNVCSAAEMCARTLAAYSNCLSAKIAGDRGAK